MEEFYASHGAADSELWLQHTEDPSQGHGQHHSLHHYSLIFKAERLWADLRDCSYTCKKRMGDFRVRRVC